MGDPILPQAEMEQLVVSQHLVSNAALDEVVKFVSNTSCESLESTVDSFSKLIGLKIAKRNESMGKLSYMVSNYAILEVAENVFHIGSGFTKLDLTGFTLSRILDIVKSIEEKINIFFDSPQKKTVRHFKSAMIRIEENLYEEAYEKLNSIIDE